MKVWIITKVTGGRSTSYSSKRLRETAKEHGIKIRILNPMDFEIITSKDDEHSLLYKGKVVTSLPDVVVPKMGAGTTSFALALLRHFERLGVYLLNSSTSVETAKDKLASIQLLAKNGVAIPKTILARTPLDIPLIKKELGFPLVLKKVSSSQGKGIVLCKNATQLQDTIEVLDPAQDFIIQHFIKESSGKDIRVFILGGKAIGAMLRKGGRGSFKSNFKRGGSVESIELTAEMEWLAIEAARLLDLEMAGVDLLFDKGSYSVCEVNSNPGFEGFELATGINVPQMLFNFLKVRTDGIVH